MKGFFFATVVMAPVIAFANQPLWTPFDDTRVWFGDLQPSQSANATTTGYSRVSIKFKGGFTREDVELFSYMGPISTPNTYSFTSPFGVVTYDVRGYETVTGFQQDPNDQDTRIYSYSNVGYIWFARREGLG